MRSRPRPHGGSRPFTWLGLRHMSHRPHLVWRYWLYSAASFLLPVVVILALPGSGSSMDELVWLVTLVPAFLLSLHYGLRGAFVALLVGTAVFLGVQLALLVTGFPTDPRITVPIYMAYGALAISVGWLSEQLHDHYEYVRAVEAAQKTEALGTMAAGIAHDFNNVLTTMVANAELLAGGPNGQGRQSSREMEELRAAARRGAGMVRNLLGFSRRGMLLLRPMDLTALVRRRLPALQDLVPETIEVRAELAEGLPPVLADEGAVEQILVNLVTNARDAMPYSGVVLITVDWATLDDTHLTRRGWGDPGRYVCLSVGDTGVGMDAECLEKIFEPFFTGKRPGEAVGLGMAMVYGLMKQHRGFVDVESEPGLGTTVRAYFSVTRAPVQEAVPSVADPGSLFGGTVLLVEDDEAIRDAARRILERAGYRILLASDGEEGMEKYRKHEEEVDLILTDIILPKRTGPELYRALKAEGADPRVLFMSGYPAKSIRESSGLEPGAPFLQKPWTASELIRAVSTALRAEPQRT